MLGSNLLDTGSPGPNIPVTLETAEAEGERKLRRLQIEVDFAKTYMLSKYLFRLTHEQNTLEIQEELLA